jgi:hypothetical protein
LEGTRFRQVAVWPNLRLPNKSFVCLHGFTEYNEITKNSSSLIVFPGNDEDASFDRWYLSLAAFVFSQVELIEKRNTRNEN